MLASDKHSSLLWCSVGNKEKIETWMRKRIGPPKENIHKTISFPRTSVYTILFAKVFLFFFATPAPAKFARMFITAN